jgi:hypothetical protein
MRPIHPEPAEFPLIKKALRAARFMKWGAPVVAAAALVLSVAIAVITVWYAGVVLLLILLAALCLFGYSAARCPHCGQVWWSALGMFGAAPWGLMECGSAAQEAETESFVCRRCHLDIGPALKK